MLIGICGAPGCGKDTLADQMVSHDVYEKYRFADPIKAMLAQFHIPLDLWEDHDAKESIIPWLGKSPRYLAQTLGTEWGRELIHKDIWVKFAQGRWNVVNAARDGRMVCSDVRFENEAKWINDAGGVLVRIERPGNEHEADNMKHASEAGFAAWRVDLTIINHGQEKSELRDTAWNAINEWVESHD